MARAIVLKEVEHIRQKIPGVGVVKLHYMLQQTMQVHHIKMGRDKLYDLLGFYGLLIRRKRRRKPITTDSDHPFYKYPNLIGGLQISSPNQVWVSDITYLRVNAGFCYLSLITDAYSRKIVGYHLAPDLKSDGPVAALHMALKAHRTERTSMLIHHSDRGLQYCCSQYTALLRKYHIAISMTQNGDPYENALAERINQTLKYDFNLKNNFKSIEELTLRVDDAIRYYNGLRPHLSLDLSTPNHVHQLSPNSYKQAGMNPPLEKSQPVFTVQPITN